MPKIVDNMLFITYTMRFFKSGFLVNILDEYGRKYSKLLVYKVFSSLRNLLLILDLMVVPPIQMFF